MIWNDEKVPEAVVAVEEPPSLKRAPTSSLVLIFIAGILAAAATQWLYSDRGWMWLAVLGFYTFLGAASVAQQRGL